MAFSHRHQQLLQLRIRNQAENSRGEPRDQSPAENVWGLAGSTGNFNQMGWRKRGGTGSHRCHDEQQMGKEAIPVGWPWPSRLDIDYGHGPAGRNVDDKWTHSRGGGDEAPNPSPDHGPGQKEPARPVQELKRQEGKTIGL